MTPRPNMTDQAAKSAANVPDEPARPPRPTVGVVLQYYDSRNDVRWLLQELERAANVVVFASAGEAARIEGKHNVRTFQPAPRHYWSALWTRLFRWCGRIPRSRENYYITELTKTSWLPEKEQAGAQRRLRWRMRMPQVFSFDFLLDRVRTRDRTAIADVDAFLFITEVTDTFFLAHVLASGKPIGAYIYSWDHPCKHVNISRRLQRYFVWNRGIADDLVELQGVPAGRISSVGATQLAYLFDYLQAQPEPPSPYPFPYIYFGCSVGYGLFVRQEVRVVELLARQLAELAPDWKLVVRPYPFLSDWSLYDTLALLPNVVFDRDYRSRVADRSLSRRDIEDKLTKMMHAKAFLHLGTTMGFECAYFETPSVLLDFQDFDYGIPRDHPFHLRSFMGQYHLKKYLALEGYPNVVSSPDGLRALLHALTGRTVADLLAYNRIIRETTPLRAMPEIAGDLLQGLQSAGTLAQHPRDSLRTGLAVTANHQNPQPLS